MATDLQKMMAAKAQANAHVQHEIVQTARDIYVAMVVPTLLLVAQKQDAESPALIKHIADLAMKAAPYLHQAAGMVQIDDAKQWEKAEA